MQLLLYYLGSLVITFGIREIHLLRVIFDVGEEYCKLDEDIIKGNPNVPLFNIRDVSLLHFIPIYNATRSIVDFISYLNDPLKQLEKLENEELICEMTQIERYEYMQDHSIINLLKVLRKNYKRMKNAYYLQTFDDNKRIDGEVFYDFDEKNEIVVLDTFGVIKDLSLPEIKELIRLKGMKKLPEKSKKEEFLDKSKIVIRNINLDVIKKWVHSLTRKEDIYFIKPIVINVNEKETGISRIIIRELEDNDFEILEISGGVASLNEQEMISSVQDIVRGYMYSKYAVEVRNILGLDKEKKYIKSKS